MAKLPEDVLEAFGKRGNMMMVATVDKEKNVNLVPIGSVRIIDEEMLAFANCVPNSKTRKNLEATRRASIAVFQPPFEGFQVKGTFIKWETSGPLFDEMAEEVNGVMQKYNLPGKVEAVGKIKVTEAYALSLPIAGEKLV
jgi:hypothetical protein